MRYSAVQELLNKSTGVKPRVKTSFNLDKELFERFKQLCDLKGVSQSEVMDALLEDLLIVKETKPTPQRKVMMTKKKSSELGEITI